MSEPEKENKRREVYTVVCASANAFEEELVTR